MAKSKKIWVELEVKSVWVSGLPDVGIFRYSIVNPRTGREVEESLDLYPNPGEAIKAGIAYLRATYNTGRPQKR